MVEPGSHGEQAEVHGGGGGEEGGAGDEHSRREDQDCQTESAHVGSELTQDSAVEVHLKRVRYLSELGMGELENLAKSRDEAKHASEKVEDKHRVGLEKPAVDPTRHRVRQYVEVGAKGVCGLEIDWR